MILFPSAGSLKFQFLQKWFINMIENFWNDFFGIFIGLTYIVRLLIYSFMFLEWIRITNFLVFHLWRQLDSLKSEKMVSFLLLWKLSILVFSLLSVLSLNIVFLYFTKMFRIFLFEFVTIFLLNIFVSFNVFVLVILWNTFQSFCY